MTCTCCGMYPHEPGCGRDENEHTRGYAGNGPDEGGDRGAYCIECSDEVKDYVWPCRRAVQS